MTPIDGATAIRTDLGYWRTTASSDDVVRRAHHLRERLGAPQTVLLDNSSDPQTLTTLLNAFEELLSVGDPDDPTTVLVLDTRSRRDRQGVVTQLSPRISSINRHFRREDRAVVVVHSTSDDDRAALHPASNVYLALSHSQFLYAGAEEYVACRVAGYGAILASTRVAESHVLEGAIVVDGTDVASLAAGLGVIAQLPPDACVERMARLSAAVTKRSPSALD